MKKIPYGLSEFKEIKLDNFYYVDKTKYIPIIELLPRYIFFIRPRRFGKSLFLSMLHYYYDEKYKEEFREIFKDTWIVENKTKEANSYKILRFNFSSIDSSRYKDSFYYYVRSRIEEFVERYELDVKLTVDNPIDLLDQLFLKLKKYQMRIYCLIDEYDNFANELLSKDKEGYTKLVSEQESLFKQFFKVLKAATDMEGSPLKKMFITGVTPMTMFDVTSGFNIGMFESNNPRLNGMLGITKEELQELCKYYSLNIDFDSINTWYNNYRFSPKSYERVYNPDMVMYYVSKLLQTGEPPEEMTDINIRIDYGKLRWLVYTDKKLNGNFNLLENIVTGNLVKVSKIKDAFSAFELSDEENFTSLLYYLGLITIKDFSLKLGVGLVNETVRYLISEYMAKLLKVNDLFKINMMTFEDKLEKFALEGKLDVFKYLGEVLNKSTGIRDYIHNETAIKMLYLVYINLSGYLGVRSEQELNKGYADILIYPRNEYVKYFGLIEIKYIKRGEINEEKIERKLEEARKQLDAYKEDELVQYWLQKNKELKKIILLFHGWELVHCVEA